MILLFSLFHSPLIQRSKKAFLWLGRSSSGEFGAALLFFLFIRCKHSQKCFRMLFSQDFSGNTCFSTFRSFESAFRTFLTLCIVITDPAVPQRRGRPPSLCEAHLLQRKEVFNLWDVVTSLNEENCSVLDVVNFYRISAESAFEFKIRIKSTESMLTP